MRWKSFRAARHWAGELRLKNQRDFSEVYELSELLQAARSSCDLVGICIHPGSFMVEDEMNNITRFLQADALCYKMDNNGGVHYFLLSFGAEMTGGKYLWEDILSNPVCDDLILRFEVKDNGQIMKPTWIAAVYDETVKELYGSKLVYRDAVWRPAYNKSSLYDYSCIKSWIEEDDYWAAMLSL